MWEKLSTTRITLFHLLYARALKTRLFVAESAVLGFRITSIFSRGAENSSNFLEMTSQLGIMGNRFARKRSFPILRIT